MTISFLFLQLLFIVAGVSPAREEFNVTNFEVSNITPSIVPLSCTPEKINIDADDVTYSVNREDNTISLDWKEAFTRNNVNTTGFTIEGCVEKVLIDFVCENKETCCKIGDASDDTKTIWPNLNYGTEPANFSVCGEQKFVCLRFKFTGSANWRKGVKRLERPRLRPCPESCNRPWTFYEKILDTAVIGRQDPDSGQYKLAWNSGWKEDALCLDEATLYYGASAKPKCCEGFKNITNIDAEDFEIDICGDETKAFIKIKKGTYKAETKRLKLKNAKECSEKLSQANINLIAIGVIIGVFIIGLLLFFLFGHNQRNGDAENQSS